MPSYAVDVLPTNTGLNLGHTNQRWNANLQTVDVAGNQNVSGNSAIGGTLAVGGAATINSLALQSLGSGSINKVVWVDGIKYTTIASAIAALPVTGGMVVCPPGYRETITTQIALGDGVTSAVTLVGMPDTLLTFNITSGSGSCFVVHAGSGIVGHQMGSMGGARTGSFVISLASTCTVANVISTGDNPQGNITLEHFSIDNVNAGAVSNAFVYLLNLNDASTIRDIGGAYFPNYGMLISATTGGVKSVGPLVIDNCYFVGTRAASKPLAITSDGSGATNGVTILGGYWIDPGNSLACISLNGGGGSNGALQQINLIGVYTQQGSSTATTGISIIDAANVTVLGSAFELNTATTGHTGISIGQSSAGLTHSIVVHNFRLNSGAGNVGLSNSITGETILTSSGGIPQYIYQGTAGGQIPSPSIFGGDSSLQVGGFSSNASRLVVTSPSTNGILSTNGADGLFVGLSIDSGKTASQYAALQFSDRGTVEWEIDKSPFDGTSQEFRIVDSLNSKVRMLIDQNASGGRGIRIWRLTGNLGTVLHAADFAPSAGWGTSPVITIAQGTDAGANVTIQALATVSANPTLTLTFHDGTWTNIPVVVACRTDNAIAPTTAYWAVTSATATTAVFTFVGLPVAGSTYGLAFHTLGT